MNPLFRIPIRLQVLLIVAIVALPAAGIIAYYGAQHREQAIEHARADTRSLVEMVDSEQKLLVASAQQLLVTLAQLPEINEKDAVTTSHFLGRILRLHPNIGRRERMVPGVDKWISSLSLPKNAFSFTLAACYRKTEPGMPDAPGGKESYSLINTRFYRLHGRRHRRC